MADFVYVYVYVYESKGKQMENKVNEGREWGREGW